ncbi:hypothetical protein I4U23_001264 [Adineta vaga]|nr:hypothetical protein I4U23_001264 [Adineta vaga]
MGVCHGKQNTKYKDFFDYLLSRNGIARIPIVTLEQAVTPLIPLLPNIRNYVRLAKDKCTNPSDSLTPNESASIMLYTMGWQPEEQCLYNVLNETLSLKDHEQLQPCELFILDPKFAFETACKSNLVNLSEQNITDRDMKFIVKNSIARRCCQRVRLPNNHITAQGALVLAKGLQENDTLELLDLRNNSIGDLDSEIRIKLHHYESAHYLAEMLRKNRTLTQLYLSKNHLGDRGIELLTNALDDENNEISSMKPSTLQHLYLGENNITDVGIGYIANMLKTNRILTWLWLSNNQITTHGVELLSKVLLEDNFTLQWLFLNYNQGINDDCINTLESLFKYNYSLKTIYLYNCNLSAAAKQKLYQAVRYKTDFDLEV